MPCASPYPDLLAGRKHVPSCSRALQSSKRTLTPNFTGKALRSQLADRTEKAHDIPFEMMSSYVTSLLARPSDSGSGTGVSVDDCLRDARTIFASSSMILRVDEDKLSFEDSAVHNS